MATASIGTLASEDYSTIQAYEADLPSTLTEDEVGECSKEEFNPGALSFGGGITPGSFSITLRPATGSGFKSDGGFSTWDRRYNASVGAGVFCEGYNYVTTGCANVLFTGLQWRTDYRGGVRLLAANGLIEKFIFEKKGNPFSVNVGPVWCDSGSSGARNGLLVNRETGLVGPMVGNYGNATFDSLTIVMPDDLGPSGEGVRSMNGVATCNNVAVLGPFSTPFYANGGTFSGDYNATSAATAGDMPGANSLTSIAIADQYEDTADATRDWRLLATADLIDAGVTALSDDWVDTARPQGSSDDIGHEEAAAASGTTLSIGAASWSFAGQAATLTRFRNVAATAGAWSFAGSALTLDRTRLLAPAAGAWSFAGQALNLIRQRNIFPAAGSWSFAGQAVTLTFGTILVIAAGAWSFAGSAATVTRYRAIAVAAGSWSFAGSALTLISGQILAIAAGAWSFAGSAATVTRYRAIAVAAGSWSFAGSSVRVVLGRLRTPIRRFITGGIGHFHRRS